MFIHFNNANSPVQLPVVYPLQLWTRALYLNHVYSTQKLFSLSLPSLSPFPPSLFLSSLSLSLPPSHSLSLSLFPPSPSGSLYPTTVECTSIITK